MFDTRVRSHINALKNNKHPIEAMQSDYNEYGDKAFYFSNVGTFREDVGRDIECLLMFLYNSKNYQYGYNYKDSSGTKNANRYIKEIEELKKQSLETGLSIIDLLRNRQESNNSSYVVVNVDKIRKLAKARGMSLTKLEELLGLGNGTIGKWNHSGARVFALYKVSHFLGVNMEDLLTLVIDEQSFCSCKTYSNINSVAI